MIKPKTEEEIELLRENAILVSKTLAEVGKAVAMLEKRREETGEIADLHEKDAEFISRCHESAIDAAFAMDWKVVACASMGNLVVRSPEQIHKDVWKAVKEVIKRDE